MKRWFKRHRCPPDVKITFTINGQEIIGPVTGENLAYIAKFSGGGDGPKNLLSDLMPGLEDDKLGLYIEYVPRGST